MWIVETLQKAIVQLIVDWIVGVIDKFTSFLNNVFILSSKIVESDYVSNISAYTYKLGIAFLVFSALAQIIKLYILNESGTPEDDFVGFFIRLGKTAILMSCSTALCTMIVKLGDYIANDLLKVVQNNSEVANVLKEQTTTLTTLPFGTAMTLVILMIIVVGSLLIISIQAGKRGVELAVAQMVAPLMLCNVITTDKALYKKWLQNIGSLSATYGVQIVLLNIGMKYITIGGVTTDITNLFIGLCWLFACIGMPKALKEFAYSSGVGASLSKGASTTMSMIRTFK